MDVVIEALGAEAAARHRAELVRLLEDAVGYYRLLEGGTT